MPEHYLDDSEFHNFWDPSFPPRIEIEPGDTVVFECQDATGGTITPDTKAEDIPNLEFTKTHALTGPVFVKGAEPGDSLEIDILKIEHKNWGFTPHNPNFGLLAEDFPSYIIQHWDLDDEFCRFRGSDKVAVPYEPFPGVMGVAPAEAERLNTIPPRFNGGNVDTRGLTIGAKLFMPVFVDGALFSTGDCHAAQGDGEVCGCGIESPMRVTLKFNLRKGMKLKEFQFQTPSPLTKADSKGYHCTTAHGPDLYENSQNAVRYMIDWLVDNHDLSSSEAYVLCSVAGDLKISEIVDLPNWIVSFYFPLSVIK